jgi:cyclopropane fatty-acyl-phospholipid synthase-like methyltransferase
VPNARFVQGDILETALDEETFDAVVALYVLTHIPTGELPGLLHRISAWLRPSGVFLGTFSSAGQHDEFEADWLGVPMFFSGFDPATNEALVRAAGMRVVESRIEPMQEPEGEVRFHWLLAEKPSAWT